MKDVASIDRRGLVGVGELTTPRWSNSSENVFESSQPGDDEGDEYEVVSGDGVDRDGSDSPWTIEAIDGDSDDVSAL
jgi:dual specificity tyrosine-phosphorylation-regulated kinase 2/3/4